MKKFFSIIALLLVLLAMAVCADEVRPVHVNLNGKTVNCASYGQEATIVDGRTMVPLRAIFESLGADVIWNSSTRTALSAKDGIVVELTVGEAEIIKNGEKIKIDVPALIMNNRTLVPARAVAESFGVSVEWDKDSRTVLMTTVDTSPEIQRTGKIESPNDNHHAVGKFYFGMTLQECWDAVLKSEGEKALTSNADGINEIHIKVKDTSLLTGGNDCDTVKLLFTENYLYCVKLLSDKENENLVFTDDYVKILLYGYEVPKGATEAVNGFLEALCSFDTERLSEYVSMPNSVRRMGISSASDALAYTGFDKNELVRNITENGFGGNETYKTMAEAIVNSVGGVLCEVLQRCEYRIDSITAVDEQEVWAEYHLVIPDVKYVLDMSGELFETALTEALEEAEKDGTLNVSEMSEQKLIQAVSPMVEELFEKSCLAFLENCPTADIAKEQKLTAVLFEGQWIIEADSDFVKEILSGLNMFE